MKKDNSERSKVGRTGTASLGCSRELCHRHYKGQLCQHALHRRRFERVKIIPRTIECLATFVLLMNSFFLPPRHFPYPPGPPWGPPICIWLPWFSITACSSAATFTIAWYAKELFKDDRTTQVEPKH
ncbi:MAG: hypothetical protein J3Q66DRAFT_29854 [Benniella sp.]|nr:MAG: hypothetical protein J3Q66DRAFT_29854 [Benniella sp.]